ncbi:replication-relaxation family protein, partial [Micromonospora echinofusca]
SLDRWQPASAFHDPGVFYRHGGNPQIMVHGPTGLPRPDGAAVWTEHGRSVPFFLEYDTGRERLDILTTKIAKYERLHTMSTWTWPVLFHLPSARREANLHHRLTGIHLQAIIATTTAELRTALNASPADQVWQIAGPATGRLHLIDLPYTDTHHDTEYPPATPHGSPDHTT